MLSKEYHSRFYHDGFLKIEKIPSQNYEHEFKILSLKEEYRLGDLVFCKWYEIKTIKALNYDEAYKKYYGY